MFEIFSVESFVSEVVKSIFFLLEGLAVIPVTFLSLYLIPTD